MAFRFSQDLRVARRRRCAPWMLALTSCIAVAGWSPVLAHSAFGGERPPAAEATQDEGKSKKEDGKKETAEKGAEEKPSKPEKPKKLGKPETWDAETVAEVVLLAYGGRPALDYVCTNGREEGVIKLAAGEGNPPIEGKFTLNFLRKESSDRDNVRIEVELPNPKGEEPQQFAFGYNGAANWAAKDRQPTVLTPEAQSSFLASLVHDYMALLRFREDGAKVERLGDERVAGIDTVVLELTHRDGSKTKYFISGKTYRILHLEYEVKPTTSDKSVKLRESFYDFRAVQNVLVPMRKVLYEDSKFKQEIELKEVRYRLQKVDEEIFQHY